MGARVSTEALVLGLGLVALGVLLLLSNLGKIELLATLRTWWPAMLIVWGVVELANAWARSNSRRSSR
jgi:hypothetical protein